MIRTTPSLPLAHCAVVLAIWALAMVAGCWQEVEYVGPAPSATTGALPARPVPATEKLPDGGPVAQPTAAPANEADTIASSGHAVGNDRAGTLSESQNTLAVSEQDASAQGATAENESHSLPPWEVGSNDSLAGDNAALNAPAKPAPAEASIPTIEETAASGPVDGIPHGGETPQSDSARGTESIASVEGSSSGATNATVVGTPAESSTASQELNAANTRLDTWRLGSNLSLAALANDRNVAPENVQKWLASATSLAASLGTSFSELPERGLAGNQAASRQVLNYFLIQGQQIGRDLAKQHGSDHAALFEIAMKSNLLRVLYSPDSTSTESIGTAISQAASRAQLPASLLQPLLGLMAAKADPADVRKAVQNFHADAEQYLAARVEP